MSLYKRNYLWSSYVLAKLQLTSSFLSFDPEKHKRFKQVKMSTKHCFKVLNNISIPQQQQKINKNET